MSEGTAVKDHVGEVTKSVRDGAGQAVLDSREALTKGFEVWADMTRGFMPTTDPGGSNGLSLPVLGWIDSLFDMGESMLALQRDWVHGLFKVGPPAAPADDAKTGTPRAAPARR